MSKYQLDQNVTCEARLNDVGFGARGRPKCGAFAVVGETLCPRHLAAKRRRDANAEERKKVRLSTYDTNDAAKNRAAVLRQRLGVDIVCQFDYTSFPAKATGYAVISFDDLEDLASRYERGT